MLLPHPPTFQEAIFSSFAGPDKGGQGDFEAGVGYRGWQGGRKAFEEGALSGEEVPRNCEVAELGLDAQEGGVVEASEEKGVCCIKKAYHVGERGEEPSHHRAPDSWRPALSDCDCVNGQEGLAAWAEGLPWRTSTSDRPGCAYSQQTCQQRPCWAR